MTGLFEQSPRQDQHAAWRDYCTRAEQGDATALMHATLVNFQHTFFANCEHNQEKLLFDGINASSCVKKRENGREVFELNKPAHVLLAALCNSGIGTPQNSVHVQELLSILDKEHFDTQSCLQTLIDDQRVADSIKAALHVLAYTLDPLQLREPDSVLYTDIDDLVNRKNTTAAGLLGALQIRAAQEDGRPVPEEALRYLNIFAETNPWSYIVQIDYYQAKDDLENTLHACGNVLIHKDAIVSQLQDKALEKVEKIVQDAFENCLVTKNKSSQKTLDETAFARLQTFVKKQDSTELICILATLISSYNKKYAQSLHDHAEIKKKLKNIHTLYAVLQEGKPEDLVVLLQDKEYTTKRAAMLNEINSDLVCGYQVAEALLEKKQQVSKEKSDMRRVLESEAMAYLQKSEACGSIDARLQLIIKYKEEKHEPLKALALFKKVLENDGACFKNCTNDQLDLFNGAFGCIELLAKENPEAAFVLHQAYSKGFARVIPIYSLEADRYLQQAIALGYFIPSAVSYSKKNAVHAENAYQTYVSSDDDSIKKAAQKYLQQADTVDSKLRYLRLLLASKQCRTQDVITTLKKLEKDKLTRDHTDYLQTTGILSSLATSADNNGDVLYYYAYLLHQAGIHKSVGELWFTQAREALNQAADLGNKDAEFSLLEMYNSFSELKKEQLRLLEKVVTRESLSDIAKERLKKVLISVEKKMLDQEDACAASILHKVYSKGISGVCKKDQKKADNYVQNAVKYFFKGHTDIQVDSKDILESLPLVLEAQLLAECADEHEKVLYIDVLDSLELLARENNVLACCGLGYECPENALTHFAKACEHEKDKKRLKSIIEATGFYNVLQILMSPATSDRQLRARVCKALSDYHMNYGRFLLDVKQRLQNSEYCNLIKQSYLLGRNLFEQAQYLDTDYSDEKKAEILLEIAYLDSFQENYQSTKGLLETVVKIGTAEQKKQALVDLTRIYYTDLLGSRDEHYKIGLEYLEQAGDLGDSTALELLISIYSGYMTQISTLSTCPKRIVGSITMPKDLMRLEKYTKKLKNLHCTSSTPLENRKDIVLDCCKKIYDLCLGSKLNLEELEILVQQVESFYDESMLNETTKQYYYEVMEICRKKLHEIRNLPKTLEEVLKPIIDGAWKQDTNFQSIQQLIKFLSQETTLALTDEHNSYLERLFCDLNEQAQENPDTAYYLCLLYGKGIPNYLEQSTEMSNSYCNKAYELGHPMASCKIGRSLIDSDPKKSAEWYYEGYCRVVVTYPDDIPEFFKNIQNDLARLINFKVSLASYIYALCSDNDEMKLSSFLTVVVKKDLERDEIESAFNTRVYDRIVAFANDNSHTLQEKSRLTLAQFHIIYGFCLWKEKEHIAAIEQFEKALGYSSQSQEKAFQGLELCYAEIIKNNEISVDERTKALYCKCRFIAQSALNSTMPVLDYQELATLFLQAELNAQQHNLQHLFEESGCKAALENMQQHDDMQAVLMLIIANYNRKAPQEVAVALQQMETLIFSKFENISVFKQYCKIIQSQFLGEVRKIIIKLSSEDKNNLLFEKSNYIISLLTEAKTNKVSMTTLNSCKKIADKNDSGAQFLYAILCNFGSDIGLPCNRHEFSNYLQRAAQNKFLPALLLLGGLYCVGDNVITKKENLKEAVDCFLQAIALGSKDAYFFLGIIYHRQQRYADAKEAFTQACQKSTARLPEAYIWRVKISLDCNETIDSNVISWLLHAYTNRSRLSQEALKVYNNVITRVLHKLQHENNETLLGFLKKQMKLEL